MFLEERGDKAPVWYSVNVAKGFRSFQSHLVWRRRIFRVVHTYLIAVFSRQFV